MSYLRTNKFKYEDVVMHIETKKVYRVSIAGTKNDDIVVKDIKTNEYLECDCEMFVLHVPKEAYKPSDRVYVENHSIGTIFVIKTYYERTNTAEIFPLGRMSSSFFINAKLLKLDGSLPC